MINIAHTVTTAGLLNPDKASWGVIKPVKANVPITSKATMSIRTQPVKKSTSEAMRMEKTKMISKDMLKRYCTTGWYHR